MRKAEINSQHQHTADDVGRNPENEAPRKILTYKDLLEEEQRMEMKHQRAKAELGSSYTAIRDRLQPASQALNFMNKIIGVQGKPGFLAQGVDIVADLVAKKYLFRSSNWLVTLAGSYLVRGLSQAVVSRGKGRGAIWSKGQSQRDAPGPSVHSRISKHPNNGMDQAGSDDTLNQ